MKNFIFIVILFVLFTGTHFFIGAPYSTPLVGNIKTQDTALFIAYALAWIMNLQICIIGGFAAFMRFNRYGLTLNHPVKSWIISYICIFLPFLGVFINWQFSLLMMILLTYSQIRSQTGQEKDIDFLQSNAAKNVVITVLFALVLLILAVYPYPK